MIARRIVVLVIATCLLQFTRIGKATRAVSDNPALAASSGINVERVISVVWIGGAALTGLAGALLGAQPGLRLPARVQASCCSCSPRSCSAASAPSGARSSARFIIGIFIELSTLFIAGRAQVRRRTGRADRRAADPTAGPPRPSAADRLRRERHGLATICQPAPPAGSGPTAIVYCLAAIGLNIHFGYTGLLNFGQAGFMAVAGYALASHRRPSGTCRSGSASSSACVLTLVLALLLGVPTLRLRADYLAIVTIAAAEIIRQVDLRREILGVLRRPDGLTGVHRAVPRPQPVHRAGSASRAS